MPGQVRLRPIGPGDEQLLYGVYSSTRQEELAPVPWTEEQKAAFLWMQFQAQHAHYQRHYAAGEFCVILAGDEPIGRLYLYRGRDELRIVDIALLPEHRGAGIGAELVRGVLEEARRAGVAVRIHVEQHNRALGFYERLGFRRLGVNGVYLLMEWTVPVVS